MQTKIQKWGNSLAIRIPKAFVKEAHVAYGTPVDLSVDDQTAVAMVGVGAEADVGHHQEPLAVRILEGCHGL